MIIPYGGVDFGDEERAAINKVLERNWWGLAEEGVAFEKELAEQQKTKHAIFVSSGSAALELSIASFGFPPGAEVIVPATTFPTPIASLLRNELIPVVVDVANDFQLSPEAAEAAITKSTVALLVVNVAGILGDYDKYTDIAKRHNLKLIVDDCDGFGGTWDDATPGSMASMSTVSTHAAHIIATGQGGVVFTDDDGLARRVREMRDWGRTINFESGGEEGMPVEYQRYTYTQSGYNFQPLELQAAMGRVQLRKLEKYKEARRKHYNLLAYRLQDQDVVLPHVHAKADSCYLTFPMLVKDRVSLVKRLDKAGIEWRPVLAGNIVRQPYYADKVDVRGELPMADRIFDEGIWLPIHPLLTDDDMEYIAKHI